MGLRILVTGGAGYIGGATARLLLDQGHQVTALDNLSRGHRAAVPEGASLAIGDFGDAPFLKKVFGENRFDAVMHFAAFCEVGESMQQPAQYFRNNTSSTLTLLDACIAHKISRFVFSSTAAVFGEPESPMIEESAKKDPVNVYGESKLQVERILRWFQQIYGLRYAALRYFNAAGAWRGQGEDHHPESHLIPIVLQVALGKREFVSIYGADYPTPDGTCVRDYIHIYDLAMAHLLALNALEFRQSLEYNLGNGQGFSVRQVIETARRLCSHPIPARDGPRRPGDPAVLVASSEKIRRELGWAPKYAGLEAIIESAWEWHRAHPNGYAKE